jgi:hypothetical protein
MPLSEDEKSRLDEIAAHVRATDPDFAQRLRSAGRERPARPEPVVAPARVVDPQRQYNRRLIQLSCLLFVSVSLFANGLSAARGLISLGSVVAIIGGVLTGWAALVLIRFHRASRPRPA